MPVSAQGQEAFTGGLVEGPSIQKKKEVFVPKSFFKKYREEFMSPEDRENRKKEKKKMWKMIIALVILVIFMVVVYSVVF